MVEFYMWMYKIVTYNSVGNVLLFLCYKMHKPLYIVECSHAFTVRMNVRQIFFNQNKHSH